LFIVVSTIPSTNTFAAQITNGLHAKKKMDLLFEAWILKALMH